MHHFSSFDVNKLYAAAPAFIGPNMSPSNIFFALCGGKMVEFLSMTIIQREIRLNPRNL